MEHSRDQPWTLWSDDEALLACLPDFPQNDEFDAMFDDHCTPTPNPTDNHNAPQPEQPSNSSELPGGHQAVWAGSHKHTATASDSVVEQAQLQRPAFFASGSPDSWIDPTGISNHDSWAHSFPDDYALAAGNILMHGQNVRLPPWANPAVDWAADIPADWPPQPSFALSAAEAPLANLDNGVLLDPFTTDQDLSTTAGHNDYFTTQMVPHGQTGSHAITFGQQYQSVAAGPPDFENDQLLHESFGHQDSASGLETLPGLPVPHGPLATFENHSISREFPSDELQPVGSRSPQALQKGRVPNLDVLFHEAAQALLNPASGKPTQHYTANKSVNKFRIAKQKPKRQRLETEKVERAVVKQAGGQCLLCTILKRKCSGGTTCVPCVEWCLGNRDLAFTICVRESPHHFDIFALETFDKPPFLEYLWQHDPWLGENYSRVGAAWDSQNALKGALCVKPLMWLFNRACAYLEGADLGFGPVFGDSRIRPRDQAILETELRSVLTFAGRYLLEYIEQGIRAVCRGYRQLLPLLLDVLLCLYSHVAASDTRQFIRPMSNAMSCYKQFLLAYVHLILPRVWPAQEYRSLRLLGPSDPRLGNLATRLAFVSRPTWLMARTKMQVALGGVYRCLHELAPASTYIRRQIPQAADHLVEISQDNSGGAGALWIRWCLMWIAIPDVVKQMMDYTANDFAASLEFLVSSPGGQERMMQLHPTRGIKDWDLATRRFQDEIPDFVVGCYWIYGSEAGDLAVLVRYLNDFRTGCCFVGPQWNECATILKNMPVSQHAQNAFRWGVVICLGVEGLLDKDATVEILKCNMKLQRYRIPLRGDTTEEHWNNTLKHLELLEEMGKNLSRRNTIFGRVREVVKSDPEKTMSTDLILESATSGLSGLEL